MKSAQQLFLWSACLVALALAQDESAAPTSSSEPSASYSPSASSAAPVALELTPTEAPSAAPSVAPVTAAPTSTFPPTGAPSSSAEPTISAEPSSPLGTKTECSNNLWCNTLNLVGECCPTTDGWMLDCCDEFAMIQGSCELNEKCEELGLEGACCPTSDEKFGYLDCCSTVPSDCQLGNENCTITSAEDYLAFVSSAPPRPSIAMMVAGTAVMMVVAVLSLV